MIGIRLNNVGKKFGAEWIFRNIDHTIQPNDRLVIQGNNGSGKSTLLQMISSYVGPNEGEIVFNKENTSIEPESIRKHVSFASPYLQLPEDLTLKEITDHSVLFKPFTNNLTSAQALELMDLVSAKDKFIRQLSSGMKQRVKLALAILAQTEILLLDEPVSNLDKNSIEWYQQILKNHSADRTIVVCSNNIQEEYFLCTSQLNVMDYKMRK